MIPNIMPFQDGFTGFSECVSVQMATINQEIPRGQQVFKVPTSNFCSFLHHVHGTTTTAWLQPVRTASFNWVLRSRRSTVKAVKARRDS